MIWHVDGQVREPAAADRGAPRVALTALGCKVNYAEMAQLAGEVAAAGCEVVPDDQPADIRVLNSCTVTLRADATTRQRLARLRRRDPGCHIVLTGCSVDGNPQRYLGAPMPPVVGHPMAQCGSPRDGVAAMLKRQSIDAVFSNAQKGALAAHVLDVARRRRGLAAPWAATRPPLRSRAFIKVQDGCDHRCTYCAVWRARGPSCSLPPDSIISQARRAAASGHAEIVLCGVDLGSYGRDLGTTLAALLTSLLEGIPQVRVRLSSINANDVGDDLIALNRHPRLCSHWHLPLQSGSDAVLKAMHRGYRRSQYLRVVRGLREADPWTELTTDVMVAFPGETDGDHAATLSIVEDVCFLACHVFRYSPRPDTPADGLKGRVTDPVARRRSAEVRRAAMHAGSQARRRALGRVHEVVWDRVEPGRAHGLASTYHLIIAAPTSHTRAGSLQRVHAHTLEAEHIAGDILEPPGGMISGGAERHG
ncbi:MAG: MiaB/RimO family radical SAM methylthiotransferase [Candidatus Dormibacteria bacterium]